MIYSLMQIQSFFSKDSNNVKFFSDEMDICSIDFKTIKRIK